MGGDMDRKIFIFIFAFLLCFLGTASGVKCTHCAYVNDGECHSVVCEGKYCTVEVTVDERGPEKLVHKTCSEIDPVGPETPIDPHQHRCYNETRGGVVSIKCSCQSDFCTRPLGKEEQFNGVSDPLSFLGAAVKSVVGQVEHGEKNASAAEQVQVVPAKTPVGTTEPPPKEEKVPKKHPTLSAVLGSTPLPENPAGGGLPGEGPAGVPVGVGPPGEGPAPEDAAGEEGPAIAQELAETNVSATIGIMERVISDRVNFFSAASLQRLTAALAANVVLTPEEQHYDVGVGTFDGDMHFNELQLDDIVENEMIFLPPKPILKIDGKETVSFNGVLIGRDLEQVNAWPTLEPIPYKFNPSVDPVTRSVVRAAFDLYGNNTCVAFHESTKTGQFVFEIDERPAPGSSVTCGAATVGRWPHVKLQIWKAGKAGIGCLTVGAVAHQVGHILGLWHTQSRFDAYNYVYVMADAQGNVDVHPQSASQTNYDVGYDYGSIMHFSQDALRSRDPRFNQTMGQRREPSFIDYKTINLQQKCTELCPSIHCYVGGYATPPDCTRCHCPSGFGGLRCDRVQTSVGDCGNSVGARFASNDWAEVSATFPTDKGAENENSCYWHIWGSNGSQVEVEIIKVNLAYSAMGCTNDKTGERNFLEVKIGNNDADKSYDFQRTGFRLCNMDALKGSEASRPIVSSNRLIVLIAHTGSKGSISFRYRNAGGGNAAVANDLENRANFGPIRTDLLANPPSFNASKSKEELDNTSAICDIRRSLVLGDRLGKPCRRMQSDYGRYTYLYTKHGHHKIYFTQKYAEPVIILYDVLPTPRLDGATLINENGTLKVEDNNGKNYQPFPTFLSAEKQQVLGQLKLVMTEDGRLTVRSHNGTEVTVACVAHFACVRLHKRLQSPGPNSKDTWVMLQGGVIYSDDRLSFATLDSNGELAVWQRNKSTDPLSISASKMVWSTGAPPGGKAGQPYRLLIMKEGGYICVKNGDDETTWKVNVTASADKLPTQLTLSDEGKLTLADVNGAKLWTN